MPSPPPPPSRGNEPEGGAEILPAALALQLDQNLATGARVGEYEVVAKLGAGTFGVVYRAIHPLIGKGGAIKVLARAFSSQPDTVSRFLAEARAVNTIRHPNIVDIFNFGTLDDGRLYYVMELLEGMTLADYARSYGPVAPGTLCRLLRGVAKALDAAHRQGILHRDVKPENVFLARQGDGNGPEDFTPKLLDFGVAKLTADALRLGDHHTRTGAAVGTPHFMSPEQCLGLTVDHRTDVYAFGVMCFEALTGRLPFEGQSLLELMNQHAHAARPLVSEWAPQLGRALDEPMSRILAIDPFDRPSSVAEALDLLEQAAVGAQREAPIVSSSHGPADPESFEDFGEAPTERVRRQTRLARGTSLETVVPHPSTRPPVRRGLVSLAVAVTAGGIAAGGGVLAWRAAATASRPGMVDSAPDPAAAASPSAMRDTASSSDRSGADVPASSARTGSPLQTPSSATSSSAPAHGTSIGPRDASSPASPASSPTASARPGAPPKQDAGTDPFATP
jgi:serine/threonine protein kinase